MIKKIFNNPVLMGSLVMVLGSNIYNIGQFVFHFLSGRFLGKVYYGDLAAIISFLGLIGIVQLSVGLTIVKYISSHPKVDEQNNFIKWIFHWNNLIGLGLSLLVLLLSPFISQFLNITQPLSLYVLVPTVFLFMVASTGRSILQGLLQFNKYVLILLSETLFKISLMLIFIFLGYALFGAMFALLLGIGASVILTKIFLNKYLAGKRSNKPEIKPLLKYSSATFIQGLALTSMYSADLMLVKHFFSPDEAGLYAALAILGRIVFFGVSPIASVMFPYVSKKYSLKEPYLNIFYLSLFLVLLAALTVVSVFWLVPNLAILSLYGPSYLEGAKYLWWFGLYMSLLALAMLLTQFYLSLGKTKIVSVFVAAAILQIILIWFNHQSILSVVQMSLISAGLLLVSLTIYFPFHSQKISSKS